MASCSPNFRSIYSPAISSACADTGIHTTESISNYTGTIPYFYTYNSATSTGTITGYSFVNWINPTNYLPFGTAFNFFNSTGVLNAQIITSNVSGSTAPYSYIITIKSNSSYTIPTYTIQVGSFSLPTFTSSSITQDSEQNGYNTNASGNFSHAEGDTTSALGDFSHAEGQLTVANGDWSHAEGYKTQTCGN